MKESQQKQREHYWDGMRALLMLLGIPYHTALAYRPGRDWIVYSGEGASAFTYLAELIHLFRMPTFFILAGYFTSRLLTRRIPMEWLRGRYVRLGVPFLTCLLTLVPLLNLACEVSNLPFAEALASWRRNAATSGGYWVRHLWFLIVLLYCSTAAALVAQLRPELQTAKLRTWLDARIASRFFISVMTCAAMVGLWEAVAIELFYKAGFATNLPQEILRLDELLTFAPYFLVGCLIDKTPRMLDRVRRFSPAVTVTALVSLGVGLVFLDDLSPPLGRFVAAIAATTTAQTLIAAAKALGDRPRPWIQQLVSASFVIYLVHMPIIIVLVNLGQATSAPVMVKAPAIMLLALLLSYGAWLVIRRSAWLTFLFNGAPLPSRTRPGLV